MTSTWGTEIEFDTLERDGAFNRYRYSSREVSMPSRLACTHDDCTVGMEIVSPVFKGIKSASTQLNRIFSYLNQQYSGMAPVLKGSAYHVSIGAHFHVGEESCDWNASVKTIIAKHIKSFYPFLIALYANDRQHNYASYRIPRNDYLRALGDSEVIGWQHYDEINGRPERTTNFHGATSYNTVELRAFDANIPQVTLTVARLLMAIVRAARAGKALPSPPIGDSTYTEQRRVAYSRGLRGLDVAKYMDWFWLNYGSEYYGLTAEEGGLLPCEDEILFNVMANHMNPADIASELGIYGHGKHEFDYFRTMSAKTEAYLANLTRILGKPTPTKFMGSIKLFNSKIEVMQNNGAFNRNILLHIEWILQQLKTGLDDRRIIDDYERFSGLKRTSCKTRFYLWKNVAKECRNKEEFQAYVVKHPSLITANRIKNVVDLLFPAEEAVAKPVEFPPETRARLRRITDDDDLKYELCELLNLFGDQTKKDWNYDDVTHADERFYVFTGEIGVIGCAAVRLRDGHISHLVVNPCFRRLGYGRILVQHALNVLIAETDLPTAKAWIKIDNEPSKALFSKLGFTCSGINSEGLMEYSIRLKPTVMTDDNCPIQGSGGAEEEDENRCPDCGMDIENESCLPSCECDSCVECRHENDREEEEN